MCCRSAGETGFSLVESVVACALLAVGVLSLAQLFATAVSMNAASRDATLAAILAAQKLEEVRTSAAPVPDVEFLDSRGNPVARAGDAPPSGASFVRRWTVDPLPVEPSNAAVIEVTVTPAGRDARRPAVSLVFVWRRR